MNSGHGADSFDLESLRNRLSPQTAIVTNSGPPLAAVAVIIDSRREGGSVLLIKRKETEGDPWSGQIAFPGGHRTDFDRTLQETAVREAHEEVGVSLKEHLFLGALPPVQTRTGRVVVAPFVFQLRQDALFRLNEEAAEGFWAPLSVLQKLHVSRAEVKIQEGAHTVDSYVYRGYVIWGLTFKIINLLLGKEKG